LVIAGDFNFYPHDSPYQLIHSGELPPEHSENPGGRFKAFSKMRSAYKICGSEPEFTALGCKTGKSYSEVMDYIFVSCEWQVAHVKDVGRLKDLLNSGVKCFPTESEPSDHVAIGATLYLPNPDSQFMC